MNKETMIREMYNQLRIDSGGRTDVILDFLNWLHHEKNEVFYLKDMEGLSTIENQYIEQLLQGRIPRNKKNDDYNKCDDGSNIKKLKTFELLFEKKDGKWKYDTFVRSTEMTIKEQKKFFAYALTEDFLEVVEERVNEHLLGDNEAEIVVVKFVQDKGDAYMMDAIGLAKKNKGEV